VVHAVKSKVSAMLVLLLLVGFLTPIGAPLEVQAAPGYQQYPDMNGVFGWDGDKDAPIAYVDGSFKIRDGKNITVSFGIHDGEPVKWYNDSGYLPNLVSEFDKNGLLVKIMNFADKVTLNGKDYVVAYSRVSITNNASDIKELSPNPSPQLIPLQTANKQIQPGETVQYDYAIAVDRFGNRYDWPSDEDIKNAGSWDDHYAHMKAYWEDRVSDIAQIQSLPDPRLIDAYKTGFIYTHIIKDGYGLHVGENGYDEMWDHDTIGIVSTLLTIGDFKDAKAFLSTLPAQLQYDDAKWKYSWPWALYLIRTGDIDFVKQNFAEIKKNTHYIESDRTGPDGIMKKTMAIDSFGYWTIDNWAGLMGLLSYKYLCKQLREKAEEKWAADLYDEFLGTVNKKLTETIVKYDLDYIPVSMVEPNDANRTREPRDGNWASMFLFGRWAWDGYLFGGKQEGITLDWIDKTYDYGFGRLKGLLPPHNFGGYPHGIFSSSYNAGYGSAGLRGEKYRSEGIKAYQFMIDQTMSAPFSWWEGIYYPDPSNIWNIPHTPGGGGSGPHMWGQSTATKVLFDSLIAEKIDGSVIIGRGVPEEWLVPSAKPIEIGNYPISNNRRMGYEMKMDQTGKAVTLTLTGDKPSGDVFFNLPFFKNNIQSATTGKIDNNEGMVVLPAGTTSVTVQLKTAAQSVQAPKITKAEAQGNKANLEWTFVDQAEGYTVKYGTKPGEYPNEIDAAAATAVTVGNLEPLQDYYFVVTARKGGKESEYSNFLGIRTDLPAPVEGGKLEAGVQKVDNQLSVNLTAEGTSDWIQAGGIGVNNEVRFNRKSSGNGQLEYNVKGASSASAFGDSRVITSWVDGAPGETAVNNTTGLFYSGIGNGWQLVAPAGTTERTLKIYTSVWNSKAKLEAYLSDNSAALYTDVNEGIGNSSYKVYTLKFKAGSEGQTLTIKNIAQSASGNVTFIAAALAADGQNSGVTGVTLDKEQLTMNVGETAELVATVHPETAPVKTVRWQSDNEAVATVDNGIVRATGPGTANIVATIQGHTATSKVSVMDTVADGNASVTWSNPADSVDLTEEGTVDWIHLGGTERASGTVDQVEINRKDVAEEQIAYRKIGDAKDGLLPNSPATMSWSDGRPAASVSGTRQGAVYNGVGGGWQLDIPAAETDRTLTVYTGAWSAKSKLELELDGASVYSENIDNRDALPIMGWSSWSSIRREPTEQKIKAAADVIADKFKPYGYEYVNLDDFYQLDWSTHVDAYGRWAVDPVKFPNGMKALGDYIHGKGLKFGLYVTPGIPKAAVDRNTPIEGTPYHAADIADTTRKEISYNFGNMYYIDYSKPGAQEYIDSWAKLFASYGVDFLKIDGVGEWDIPDIEAWSKALGKTGRMIHLGLSNSLNINYASTWQQLAKGWRTQGDVECYCSTITDWGKVSERFVTAHTWSEYAGPRGWNDFDSINVANGAADGLTADEKQSHVSLWAIAASHFYIGNDLTKLDEEGVKLLTNPEIIAVNQSGMAGKRLSMTPKSQVFYQKLPDGTYNVALFATGSSGAKVGVSWSELGIEGPAKVRDLWTRTDLGTLDGGFSADIASHASRVIKVTPVSLLSDGSNREPSEGALGDRSMPGSGFRVYKFFVKAGHKATIRNVITDKYYDYGNVSLIAAALSNASDHEVKATGIRLSDQAVTLKKGETYRVKAYVQPADATNKEVTWQSDRPQIVAVTNGVLEGKTPGTAVVTATTKDGGFNAQVHVTVTDEELNGALTIRTSFNMDALEGGKLLAAEVKITNELSHPQQVLAIAALYDGRGKMVSVSYASRSIAGGETDTLTPGFKLPQQVHNYKVKVMVWDGKNLNATMMQPLADATIKQ